MDNPILAANKSALVESLLRAIAASFGDLAHSLNLFQSVIWEGSAGPPARKGHPVIGRSSCRGHDASSRCVRRVNGRLGSQCSDLLTGGFPDLTHGSLEWTGEAYPGVRSLSACAATIVCAGRIDHSCCTSLLAAASGRRADDHTTRIGVRTAVISAISG